MMTELGKLLFKKSINIVDIARKTGINANRIINLCLKKSAKLTAEELYLIALAIDIKSWFLLKEACKGLKMNRING